MQRDPSVKAAGAADRTPGRRLMACAATGLAAALLVVAGGCASDAATDQADTTWPEPTCPAHDVDRSAIPEPTLPAGEQERLHAIADSFCARWTVRFPSGTFELLNPPLLEADAQCAARELVDLLGAERAEELGFGTGPWDLLSFGLGHGGSVDAEETASIVDAVASCSPDFERLLILSVTEGADQISAGSAACVARELDDKTAKTILAGEMDRAYDSDPDATPFPDLVAPLVDAYDRCLTPAERSLLDFN